MQNALFDFRKNKPGRKKVNFSSFQTTTMIFTRNRKRDNLGPLELRSEEIWIFEEIKHLGVVLDSKLIWNLSGQPSQR